MKQMPGCRRTRCRKCGGKGGWTRMLALGVTVFVACRFCLGRGKTVEFVGR